MKKEEKKQPYVLCPRCELNYIKAKEKYCTVCKAEMGLVDPGILLPDEEEAGLEKLCPVCQVNYIGEDEEICFLCQKEREDREAAHKKDEWEDEGGDGEEQAPIGIISLSDDDDALLEGAEEEPEEEDTTPALTEEDYDFVTAEELDALGDDEFDDEDEDEEEDEDF